MIVLVHKKLVDFVPMYIDNHSIILSIYPSSPLSSSLSLVLLKYEEKIPILEIQSGKTTVVPMPFADSLTCNVFAYLTTICNSASALVGSSRLAVMTIVVDS